MYLRRGVFIRDSARSPRTRIRKAVEREEQRTSRNAQKCKAVKSSKQMIEKTAPRKKTCRVPPIEVIIFLLARPVCFSCCCRFL